MYIKGLFGQFKGLSKIFALDLFCLLALLIQDLPTGCLVPLVAGISDETVIEHG